jgi:hypothetical protein
METEFRFTKLEFRMKETGQGEDPGAALPILWKHFKKWEDWTGMHGLVDRRGETW